MLRNTSRDRGASGRNDRCHTSPKPHATSDRNRIAAGDMLHTFATSAARQNGGAAFTEGRAPQDSQAVRRLRRQIAFIEAVRQGREHEMPGPRRHDRRQPNVAIDPLVAGDVAITIPIVAAAPFSARQASGVGVRQPGWRFSGRLLVTLRRTAVRRPEMHPSEADNHIACLKCGREFRHRHRHLKSPTRPEHSCLLRALGDQPPPSLICVATTNNVLPGAPSWRSRKAHFRHSC